jgi:riboflavin biosynthesis pyrimidine reductase
VRQLLPSPTGPEAEVDPVEVVWAERRQASPERPWVLVNMISSADGAATVEGVSGGLSGPADKAMFGALRQVPDVILVAAGTVRAEHYRPPAPPAEVQARRQAAGRTPVPRLAIVTGHLDLDLADPIFTAGASRPIVVTVAAAAPERRAAAAEVADVVVAGEGRVQLADALGQLHAMGAQVVLCEGGPSLLGQLAAADLIDELCLSVAPALVGGDGTRIVRDGPVDAAPLGLVLDRVLEEDSMLFLRYLRPR